MNKHIKLLAVLFIVAVFGVSVFVADNVSAQTNEQIIQQLQEQIEQLKAQIAILQAQLGIVSEPDPIPVPVPTPVPSECPVFSYRLYRGVSDTSTGGEVTKLQEILVEDSSVYPERLVTGYYGPLTEKAVQRWQAKHGVVASGSAATTGYGVVGPQTRAKISIVCPTPIPKPIPIPIPTDNITVLSPSGGEQWGLESNQLIQWTSGPIAVGSALAKIAYVDIDLLSWSIPCKKGEPCPLSSAPSFSTALARKVPNSGSFSWTVGKNISGSAIPTGPYVIRISNSENSSQYDQSDYAFNIVKAQTGNLPPTISGVSGPSVLKVGEAGKWEVKATDPEQGPLSYLVVWGDETAGTGISERAIPSAPSAVTQTATFTHVYSKAGVYTPTFTVTDNGGLSAKTSVSVSVSGTTTNNPPVINGIPAIPSDIKVDQSVSFSWGATDADGDNLSWSVSWGDGTGVAGACTSPNPQNKKGWTFKTSHAWQKSGIYTVKATVNDCRGSSDEHAFNIKVGELVTPTVTVISPNGGETWTKGMTQTIKWQDNTPVPVCLVGAQCAPQAPKYWDIKLITYYPPCTGEVCPSYPYVAPYTIADNVYGSSYNWSVGKIVNYDGTGGTAPDGSYAVQICQTGTSVCDSSDSYFKIVSGTTTNNPPVINGIPAIPSDIKVDQSVSFSWGATDADGDNLSWSVSWGDGTGVAGACTSPNPQNKKGWTFKTSHAWQKSGIYTVKATVNDCRGSSDEHSFSLTVN